MAKVVSLVRAFMGNTITTLFVNENVTTRYSQIKSASICNTSNSSQNVYFFILGTQQSAPTGAIYFGLLLDANETVVVPEKILAQQDKIQGYASTTDVICFCADIVQYIE